MKSLPHGVIFLLMTFLSHSAYSLLSFNEVIISSEVLRESKVFPFRFDFENTGEYPIEIKKISTSCGCTIVKPVKNSYSPKDKGDIEGTYILGDRIGDQEQEIVIETNDISKRYYKLTLQLHIKQEIDSTPRILIWRINEEPISKNVTISSIVPIKIQSIQANSNDFTISNIENKDDNMKFEFYVKPKSIKKRIKAEIKVNVINIDTDKSIILTIHSLIM